MPDILRQHLGQPGEQLLLAVTLALKTDPVAVEKHRTAITEFRRQTGLKGDPGIVLDGDAELVRHGLQQHAVARGALIGETETLDHAVLHEQHLDVLAADVADHVDIVTAVFHRAHHVRHRLDDVGVALHGLVQHIGRITGGAKAQHLQRAALLRDLGTDARQQLPGILDRVAFGQLVYLAQHLSPFIEQHRLGTGGAAVQADETPHVAARRPFGRHETRHRIAGRERGEILVISQQRAACVCPQLRVTSGADEFQQALLPGIGLHLAGLLQAEDHCAVGGVILGVVGHDDALFRVQPVIGRVTAFFPGLRDAPAPALLQKRQIGIGAAEQQHAAAQGIAAAEHRQVLRDDGVSQGIHDLRRGHARLDQVDDIGLGEHPALRRHRVQLAGVELQRGQRVHRHAHLEQALVDGRPGARGALVVHRGDHLACATVGVFAEQDDLGILATQLDDAVGLGVEFLHRQGDGVDLLHETRVDVRRDGRRAGAGDETAQAVMIHRGKVGLDGRQHLGDLLRLAGLVPLVALPVNGEGMGIDDHALHGGRTHINADHQFSGAA